MAFNKENKISWEELTPSLQDKINAKASLEAFNELKARFDNLELLSGGIRISIVSSLSNITSPVNNKELAIVTSDSVVTVYTYISNSWKKIHAVYA
jgi:hypothetical protein